MDFIKNIQNYYDQELITFIFQKLDNLSHFKWCISISYLIVQLPGPKMWLILGVSLTHFVESRYLFFLEAEIVDNIFQWDVLKNMLQVKSYDGMFQAIRVLTVQKILKIRILSQNSWKMKILSRFLLHALI